MEFNHEPGFGYWENKDTSFWLEKALKGAGNYLRETYDKMGLTYPKICKNCNGLGWITYKKVCRICHSQGIIQ